MPLPPPRTEGPDASVLVPVPFDLDGWSGVLVGLFGLSVVSLVLVIVLLPVVVVRLPADYFVAKRGDHQVQRRSLVWIVLRNVVGWVFVAAGLAMLVLPGQGLLTMLVGLLLVDFPGKRKLELKLVRRPRVLRFLNRMREKRGKPPLRVE